MDNAAQTVEQQIRQLDEARKLVLGDHKFYPQIVQGILPIVAPSARVELRRWFADFIAEAFASPRLSPQDKENMSLLVLDILRAYLENPQEYPAIVKSVVQTAASIYPHVFRYIINHPHDNSTWERMTAIKTRILRMWDTVASGVRMCCIKFAQRVVLVQTKGPDADSKRGDPSEVSLTMVPQNHPLIPPKNLEAEASGLLDRMLSVFQENISDAILVDATLNTLSILIRSRPHTANRILNVILNFNPLKQANSPMTPKLRVMVKSMEKTTRQLLIHILKRDDQNPLGPKIRQYIERMMRSKTDIFDETSRKRGPPEPTDGLDQAKRQKFAAQVPTPTPTPKFYVPPLAPGQHSVAELFTITTDDALKAFDVAMIPEDMVVKIGISILQRLDANTLNQAIDGIRQRFDTMAAAQPLKQEVLNAETAMLGVEADDDDDYEPDFYGAEDTEQILNKLDKIPSEPKIGAPDVPLAHFKLPTPPPLTIEQATQVGQGTVTRVFGVMQSSGEKGKKSKAGINRLAASASDRDAWITIISRLATRTSARIEEPSISVKAESVDLAQMCLSNTIREHLYAYVLEDFRKRIDIALAWLCEEWYNDRIQMKSGEDAIIHYEKWVLKVLDGIIPYLDGQDRSLVIKFLGEIPGISPDVLERVKGLCSNPATMTMALQSLLFLVAYRPPVREVVLDAVEDIWNTYEDARPVAQKLFKKYRPGLGVSLDETKEEQEPEAKPEDEKFKGVVPIAA